MVEADASGGEVITDALETAGFAVQIAVTARAALEALGGQPPDAILVDLVQPDEEGWAFLARCRQQRGCKTLPIAILSSTLADAAAPAHLDSAPPEPKPAPRCSVRPRVERVPADVVGHLPQQVCVPSEAYVARSLPLGGDWSR